MKWLHIVAPTAVTLAVFVALVLTQDDPWGDDLPTIIQASGTVALLGITASSVIGSLRLADIASRELSLARHLAVTPTLRDYAKSLRGLLVPVQRASTLLIYMNHTKRIDDPKRDLRTYDSLEAADKQLMEYLDVTDVLRDEVPERFHPAMDHLEELLVDLRRRSEVFMTVLAASGDDYIVEIDPNREMSHAAAYNEVGDAEYGSFPVWNANELQDLQDAIWSAIRGLIREVGSELANVNSL